LSNIATLQEIETHWTINDLADANEALDIKDALEREHIENSKRGRNK
jgi:hypothetical protein